MAKTFSKIRYKLLRGLNSSRLLSIQEGPIKGFKWSVSVPDSRYLLGNYESALADIVIDEISAGKRFVDIGANAGYFSLIAGKTSGAETKHLAVEPFPENIKLLRGHLENNDIKNVEFAQLAVADVTGTIEFSDSGNLAANTYKSESSVFRDNKIKVEATTLNDLAKKYHLNANCFIKIDVEGAEYDVLVGGQDFLVEFSPNLLLATHDCHVDGVKKQCLDFLEKIGYSWSTVEDEKISGQEDFLCVKK